MSSVQFSPNTWNALLTLGIWEPTLNEIFEKCPTLVGMLNRFVAQGGKFQKGDDKESTSSRYNFHNNTVLIHEIYFNYEGQQFAVTHLAHEVGHALSPTRLDFTSANTQALSSSLWEGEAMFYEFLAFNQIYPEKARNHVFDKRRWLDNATAEAEGDEKNVYERMHEIIYGYKPIPNTVPTEVPALTQDKIIALAELNREYINRIIGQETINGKLETVPITYDEQMKWSWLTANTYLAIDFMEMGRSDLFARNRFQSDTDRGNIEKYYVTSSRIKVLLNQAHKGKEAVGGHQATDYFGTDSADTLRAEKDGSVLGNNFGYEVLWGGAGNDIIYGSTKSDMLYGGDDDDHLYGDSGSDHLMGNRGDDYLYGGNDGDCLYGGQGDDHLYGDSGFSPDGTQIIGALNPGQDILFGGEGDDHLHGGEERDYLYGDGYNEESGKDEKLQEGGDDYLYGGEGDDELWGGRGNDILYGDDREKLHSGNDTIYGGSGRDEIYGGGGNDIIYGESEGNRNLYEGLLTFYGDEIYGGDGQDEIYGGWGDDVIYGDGDDEASGKDENQQAGGDKDWLYGGDGEDIIYGGRGDDVIYGDGDDEASGKDEKLQGKGGGDRLYGGSGDDKLYGGRGKDVIYGDDQAGQMTGDDHLYGGSGGDELYGGRGTDYLYGDGYDDESGKDENMQGDGGADFLVGGDGDDWLYGGRGKDVLYGDDITGQVTGTDHLYGGSGDDELYGGRGTDYLYGDGYGNESGKDETLQGDGGSDFLVGGDGDDWLYGGRGRDILYGDDLSEDDGASGNDHLYGGSGNDDLFGGKGNDRLYGGTGRNELYGGTGFDRYYLASGGFSTIIDEDRSGVLYFGEENGVRLKGGKSETENISGGGTYHHTDNKGNTYVYVFDAASPYSRGKLTIKINGQTVAEIPDFQNGEMGIKLVVKPEERSNDDFDDFCIKFIKVDPLALDLDGGGFQTVSPDAGILFDHEGDGVKQRSGWLAPGDGWLVYDRNEDGQINDGSELFGENTARYDGPGNCFDGFSALAQEDSNGDGVIDSQDENWEKIKVWRDLNQNGQSEEGELFSLEELGISALNLDYDPMNKIVDAGRQTGQGTYVKADGSTGLTGQFDLNYDPFHREYTEDIEIPEHLAHLPTAEGSGALRDLLEAVALEDLRYSEAGTPDEAPRPLREALAAFSRAANREEQLAALEELMYQWALTAETLSEGLAERCEGYYRVNQTNIPGGDLAAWERRLFIVEAFSGRYALTLPKDLGEGEWPHPGLSLRNSNDGGLPILTVNWSRFVIDSFDKAYEALFDSIYNALTPQTRLLTLFDLIDEIADQESGQVRLDFTRLTEYFRTQATEDPLKALGDLKDFTAATNFQILEQAWNGYDLLMELQESLGFGPEMAAVYDQLGLGGSNGGSTILSGARARNVLGETVI